MFTGTQRSLQTSTRSMKQVLKSSHLWSSWSIFNFLHLKSSLGPVQGSIRVPVTPWTFYTLHSLLCWLRDSHCTNWGSPHMLWPARSSQCLLWFLWPLTSAFPLILDESISLCLCFSCWLAVTAPCFWCLWSGHAPEPPHSSLCLINSQSADGLHRI